MQMKRKYAIILLSIDLFKALKIRKLFNQLVFATEHSLKYLQFKESEHCSPRTLYAMYQDELLTGSYDYPEDICSG